CDENVAENCLTSKQIDVAKKLYAGVGISSGALSPMLPGSEPYWSMIGYMTALPESWYNTVVYPDREHPWTVKDFDPEKDIEPLRKTHIPAMRDRTPDVSQLAKTVGKLIIYTGTNDSLV